MLLGEGRRRGRGVKDCPWLSNQLHPECIIWIFFGHLGPHGPAGHTPVAYPYCPVLALLHLGSFRAKSGLGRHLAHFITSNALSLSVGGFLAPAKNIH